MQDPLARVHHQLQTANEELQTANEELETTNEELQSTNGIIYCSHLEVGYADGAVRRHGFV